MIRIILNVQGMMCAKCEERVNRAVERAVCAENVRSSRKHGTTELLCADGTDAEMVESAVEAAGYPVTGVVVKKKVFWGCGYKL